MNDNQENLNMSEDEIDQLNFAGDLSEEYNEVGIHPNISSQYQGGMVAVYFRYTPILPPDWQMTNLYIFGGGSGGPHHAGIGGAVGWPF